MGQGPIPVEGNRKRVVAGHKLHYSADYGYRRKRTQKADNDCPNTGLNSYRRTFIRPLRFADGSSVQGDDEQTPLQVDEFRELARIPCLMEDC